MELPAIGAVVSEQVKRVSLTKHILSTKTQWKIIALAHNMLNTLYIILHFYIEKQNPIYGFITLTHNGKKYSDYKRILNIILLFIFAFETVSVFCL